ncbi:Rieske (2Fe-2S) protein [Rufibacter tibetensis]|uniref:Rieske (2Fe-2S) protein n=1 Tax=Rufibacter tibetensis TaxID=512763 RepID=A0A0N7HW12_9BACT|nr:Rieske 2Fe-2S domain-containing protein [Rufibacter tibetensis]ALI97960.1 Rieske (2Fe-2S) protein [Rufibacter tibetensis]
MQWIKLFDSEDEAKKQIPVTRSIAVVAAGQEICIAHTPSGLFAVENLCPHLGDALSRGTTNYLNEIICPWHSYRFHLISGEECKGRTRPLKRFTLETREGGVYVEVPEETVESQTSAS